MIGLDERYERDPSMVFRDIAGEMILVPIRQNVGDLESIYTLNETAARVWALLDGQMPVSAVADKIVEEFEVEQDEARRDVLELLEQLASVGAVKRA